MISTIILIISAFLLISTYGLHSYLYTLNELHKPAFIRDNLFLSLFVWIAAYLLPVIIWSQLINIHWIFLLLINFVFVFILCFPITNVYVSLFTNGRNLGKHLINTIVFGIILLIIGTIL